MNTEIILSEAPTASIQGPEPSTFDSRLSTDVAPWPDPVDGKLLLDDLRLLLQRFVVLPNWAAETLALWILHTYAFHLRDVSTYLGLESPVKRCGKTTLLSVLSELVNRPVVAANISSPAFFRVIQELQPTLLIDEADTLLQGNDELRGILNAGYHRKTAYVVRVTTQDFSKSLSPLDTLPRRSQTQADRHSTLDTRPSSSSLARFSCWCPKAIAAIGRLPDTLADRCIVIRMQRKTAKEQCERLRKLQPGPLRRQCLRFITDHADAIAQARPDLPPSLNDRAADVWEPLLALADLAGGDWPQLARQAAVSLTSIASENNPIGSLLLDIFITFTESKSERLFSRTLVTELNRFAARPWMEMCKGKEITELWLAQQLRPYGIRPRTLWIGEAAAKGYVQAEFMDIFRRYITKSDLDAVRMEPKPRAKPAHSEKPTP